MPNDRRINKNPPRGRTNVVPQGQNTLFQFRFFQFSNHDKKTRDCQRHEREEESRFSMLNLQQVQQ